MSRPKDEAQAAPSAPTGPTPSSQRLEKTVHVDASVEAVWRAFSDPAELVRWFPLEADVEPGEGGSIRLSWGPGCEGTAPITAWEPLSRLAWTEVMPAAEEGAEPGKLVAELRLEAKGGQTVVRLVQHGFGLGDEWDDYFDALDSGWTYFLWNLAHYLERHHGTPRDMVWVRRPAGVPRDAFWRRLFAEGDGLLATDGTAEAGEPYRLRLGGEQGGHVRMATPGAHFAGSVEDLNDGLLFVELEMGDEGWHCGIWLSTYGLPPERVEALQEDLERVADRLFAA